MAHCEMEPGPPIKEISPQNFTPLDSIIVISYNDNNNNAY